MKKKMVLVLLMATILAGGVFAQMSAGIGANFGIATTKYSHPDYDITSDDQPKPIAGGGFHAFFDADYVLIKAGLFIGGNSEDSVTATYTYLSLGLLGKFPIDLGGFTLFPMIGFEYNTFQSLKMAYEGASVTMKRSDIADLGGDASFYDMFILQLGAGIDLNLGNMYLRPSLLWGVDLASNDSEKAMKDAKYSIFKSKLDIGVALGFKF